MAGERGRPPLALRVMEQPSGAVVIHVQGAVDFATAPPLRAVLFDLVEDARPVVVDLGSADFLDAHSVGMLVSAHRRACDRPPGYGPGGLCLRGATGPVLRVLEITGADKLLEPREPDSLSVTATDAAEDRTIETLLRSRARRTGDEAVCDRLRELAIYHAYPLATALARRYGGRGEPIEDLTQTALLALIKAVDGYDPQRATAFASYAVPTITGELKRHFRDKGWQIRIPRALQEIRLELNGADDELTQHLGRTPTIGELAARLGTTQDNVLEAMQAANIYRLPSLSGPASGNSDDDTVIADRIGSPDDGYDKVEYRESLRPLIAALPARQRRILALRFYGNLTQSQIAARVGISQMHVSRLLTDALTRLRRGLVAG